MGNIIPYFYYDIVARIIPGVVTLGVLAFAGPNLRESFSRSLAGSKDWNSVLYEALFSLPVINWYKKFAERMAWESAVRKFDKANGTTYEKESSTFRTQAWEKLVLESALEPERMKSVFAHCHRFQAEAKMSQHLMIAALVFPVLAHFRGSPLGCVDFVFLLECCS
jgi:hypothetical protein